MADLITPAMRDLIGKPFKSTTSFPIGAGDIRRWAIAVYYPEPPPPRFWDEDHAKATVWGGIVAPDEFNPFAWMSRPGPVPEGALEVDPALVRAGASEHLLGVAPPELRTGINGGMSITLTGVPMRPGDEITATSSISEYRQRSGRLGEMLFTSTDDVWTNQRGELVKTVRMTLIRY